MFTKDGFYSIKGDRMSRYVNPPKSICMVRTLQGKWTNTDANPTLLTELGLKVALYDLRPENAEKPHLQHKKQEKGKKEPKTEATASPQSEDKPIMHPPEEINAPASEPAPLPAKPQRRGRKPKTIDELIKLKKSKPKYICKCGYEFDEPILLIDGSGCPNCSSPKIKLKE